MARALPIPVVLLVLLGVLTWWLMQPNASDPVFRPHARAVPLPSTPPPILQGAPPVDPSAEPQESPEVTWRITYEVLDADGTPRHHMGGTFHRRAGEMVAEAVLTEEGPATEGTLDVTGSGYVVVRSYHRVPWVSDWLEPPSSGQRHLVVRLDRGLTISGVLLQADGETRLTSGTVRLWSKAPTEPLRPRISSREVLVKRDGTFRFDGLPPGPVRLRAETYDRTLGGPVEIEAGAGDEDLRVLLRPAGGVAFLLVDDSTGRALQTKQWAVYQTDGEKEQLRTSGTINRSDEPPEAKPTMFLWIEPGRTHRFRAEAHGYAPCDAIAVDMPAEGGRRTVRFDLTPAPAEVAMLTIRLRTAVLPFPEWMNVTRYLSELSRNSLVLPVVDERVSLELIPGVHRLSVGGGWHPKRENGSMFLVPVDFEVELNPGDDREVEVWLARGGWVVIVGDPNPRPHNVAFTQEDEVVTCSPSWGRLGEDTGYKLAVLPPGVWKLEYVRRERGLRATVEVKAGDVTRLTPERLEAFDSPAQD